MHVKGVSLCRKLLFLAQLGALKNSKKTRDNGSISSLHIYKKGEAIASGRERKGIIEAPSQWFGLRFGVGVK